MPATKLPCMYPFSDEPNDGYRATSDPYYGVTLTPGNLDYPVPSVPSTDSKSQYVTPKYFTSKGSGDPFAGKGGF